MKRGLSAGRVQSVALRIICDREDEINSFIPEEYWSLEGEFRVKGEKKPLQAKFYGTDKKLPIHNKAEMDELLGKLENAEYEITGQKVLGIGDASGMLPIDPATKNYSAEMIASSTSC